MSTIGKLLKDARDILDRRAVQEGNDNAFVVVDRIEKYLAYLVEVDALAIRIGLGLQAALARAEDSDKAQITVRMRRSVSEKLRKLSETSNISINELVALIVETAFNETEPVKPIKPVLKGEGKWENDRWICNCEGRYSENPPDTARCVDCQLTRPGPRGEP